MESDFKYVIKTGETFVGVKAVERLAKDYPAVLSYFWILPKRYQLDAMKIAYKAGGVIRKVVKTALRKKEDCNCGGRKI